MPEKNVIFILLVFKVYEGNKCIRYTVKDQSTGDLVARKVPGLLWYPRGSSPGCGPLTLPGGARACGPVAWESEWGPMAGHASPDTRCSPGGGTPPTPLRPGARAGPPGAKLLLFSLFLRLGGQACRVLCVRGVQERVCECACVFECVWGGSGVGTVGRGGRVHTPSSFHPARGPSWHP